MSDPNTKHKTSKRRYDDETAIKRQVRIAKQHGYKFNDEVIREPHRLAKHHAMDCGQPGCTLCGNPRKIFKEKTMQEKRFYQDTDNRPHKHGKGIYPEESD